MMAALSRDDILEILKAEQLGFTFGAKKPAVKRPGSRGGRGYYTRHGVWQYGAPPKGHRPATANPESRYAGEKLDDFLPEVERELAGRMEDLATMARWLDRPKAQADPVKYEKTRTLFMDSALIVLGMYQEVEDAAGQAARLDLFRRLENGGSHWREVQWKFGDREELRRREQLAADPKAWSTGQVDPESMRRGYVELQRSPADPERSPRVQGGRKDKTPHRTIKQTPQAEWAKQIAAHLADGVPRTFNQIGVEMLDHTADVLQSTNFRQALWDLVEQGQVEHTMEAPVLFRKREAPAAPQQPTTAAEKREAWLLHYTNLLGSNDYLIRQGVVDPDRDGNVTGLLGWAKRLPGVSFGEIQEVTGEHPATVFARIRGMEEDPAKSGQKVVERMHAEAVETINEKLMQAGHTVAIEDYIQRGGGPDPDPPPAKPARKPRNRGYTIPEWMQPYDGVPLRLTDAQVAALEQQGYGEGDFNPDGEQYGEDLLAEVVQGNTLYMPGDPDELEAMARVLLQSLNAEGDAAEYGLTGAADKSYARRAAKSLDAIHGKLTKQAEKLWAISRASTPPPPPPKPLSPKQRERADASMRALDNRDAWRAHYVAKLGPHAKMLASEIVETTGQLGWAKRQGPDYFAVLQELTGVHPSTLWSRIGGMEEDPAKSGQKVVERLHKQAVETINKKLTKIGRTPLVEDYIQRGGGPDPDPPPLTKAAILKAAQLGFDFQKKPVQRPGSRGGRFYHTPQGEVRYGERPAMPPPPQREERWPSQAKHYGDDQIVQHWEVLLPEFTAEHLKRNRDRVERSIAHYREQIGKLGTRQQRKRDQFQAWIAMWESDLERLDAGDDAHLRRSARVQYVKLVKHAISKGKRVPVPVVAQSLEFRKAVTARQRYEKGRHTSFGNVSSAVDNSMQAKRGYKVKRQDGKPMTHGQRDEIARGMDEIEKILGPVGDICRDADLTIAHTSGKHPFLRNVGGLFSSGERTISMGIEGRGGSAIPALGHEFAHFLDFEAGRRAGKLSKRYPKRGTGKVVTSTSLAEAEAREYSNDGEGRALIAAASRGINDTMGVQRRLRSKLNATDDVKEKAIIERAKVSLGPYWRDPCEVWARLVEQYMATKAGKGGVSVDSPDWYGSEPGWWMPEVFAGFMPAIEREIQRRLAILREPKGGEERGGAGGE